MTIAPVFDIKGKCTQLIGTIHDLTERKRGEDALEKSEEEFRQLFDDAPLGNHEVDVEGKIKNVNRMAARDAGLYLGRNVGSPRLDI